MFCLYVVGLLLKEKVIYDSIQGKQKKSSKSANLLLKNELLDFERQLITSFNLKKLYQNSNDFHSEYMFNFRTSKYKIHLAALNFFNWSEKMTKNNQSIDLKQGMSSNKSNRGIKPTTTLQLWAKSAGRCQFCNKILYVDTQYGHPGNFAERAHIHAVSPRGARFLEDLTVEEKNDCQNLMLLCAEHHKMVDDNPEEFIWESLVKRKEEQEKRIRAITDINGEQSTIMLSFFSFIGKNQSFVLQSALFKEAVIFDGLYPKVNEPVEIKIEKYSKEMDTKYFEDAAEELEIQFNRLYKTLHEEESLSVFSLAPQPLLIKLGTLLNDESNVKVFQCHRNGHKWAWKKSLNLISYRTTKNHEGKLFTEVNLNVSLSANISNERIQKTVDQDYPIYTLSIESPNRDFVHSEQVCNLFIKEFRKVMEQIKLENPDCKQINLFPCMPNSLAVRLGMDIMSKTDLPITIYDQVSSEKGFIKTITIGGSNYE